LLIQDEIWLSLKGEARDFLRETIRQNAKNEKLPILMHASVQNQGVSTQRVKGDFFTLSSGGVVGKSIAISGGF